jgi:putative DNA primase/helicase
MMDARTIANVMGGIVSCGAALVPGPGHKPCDRSLRVFVDPNADAGFGVHSFANDDPIKCRDYVLSKLGLPAWEPSRNRAHTNGYRHTNGHAKPNGNGAAPAIEAVAQNDLPRRTPPDASGKPKFFRGGDDGPVRNDDELRRHVYCRDKSPVRIKIKRAGGGFVQWYRVRDGNTLGWQAKKPEDYRDVPYIGAVDPFDPELVSDSIYWPEGEKDCDTLGKINIPALTFGGVGDGLPNTAAGYLSGRHFVILSDNDEQGRDHAEKKAALAHSAGAASIRIVHFPELPPHGDVSDFIAGGDTADELEQRADAAPNWCPAESSDGPLPLQEGSRRQEELGVVKLSDVKPERTEWLWSPRIAAGKLTLFAGDPGLGKSQATIDIAARITTGASWPDGGYAPIGNVIVLSAEDAVADTLRPRFEAAGANLDRVQVVTAVTSREGGRRTFTLQSDLSLLAARVRAFGDVKLVTVDPVTSYCGKVDGNSTTDIRGVLAPLSEFAEHHRLAVIAVSHPPKSAANGKALYAVTGSLAWIAAARTAFTIIEDADDRDRRLFLNSKNNLAPLAPGIGYRLVQRLVAGNCVASHVEWDNLPVTVNADQALAATAGGTADPSSTEEAVEFFRGLLACGEVPVDDIEAEARAAGLLGAGQRIGHNKALRRGRERLGVISRREGFGPGAKYYLRLPASSCAPAKHHARPVSEVGAHGAHGGDGGER